jgi:hypothetical protein
MGFATLIMLTGCGRGTKNPLVPVEGKVQFSDGKLLPLGTRLRFNPMQGGVGSAMGTTGEDGSFQVTHANGSSGAEEGKYVILLLAPEEDTGNFDKVVPKRYSEEGILVAEVKQGMSPLEFKVKVGR